MKTNIKKIILLLSIILFVFSACYESDDFEHPYTDGAVEQCLGVPVITETMLQKIACNQIEAYNIVYMNGALLPYDKEDKRLFLSCCVTQETKYQDIEGTMKSGYSDYQLYFLKEKAFESMSEAVKNNHPFTLTAVDKNGDYMSFQLIFTTLPIVELHGKSIKVDYRDREIYSGELNVWEPPDAVWEETSLITNRLEWKLRGNTAMNFPKKSYKLSLKDRNRKSENVSLLGLEKDDDYILNPMWMDDLKVREKLAITLWNEIAEEKQSALRMSESEYCEVLINDSYQGIYLLQKRIEKKTLKLDEEDILLKGMNIDPTEDNIPEDVFEIVYSGRTKEETYHSMENFLNKEDFSNVDLENWVDLQLFLHLGNMNDNRRYKNIYYVLKEKEGRLMLQMIPWDTDMSFGVTWADGFAYLPENVEELYNRVEYEDLLSQYPELENTMKKRWHDLRSSVFSEENILKILDSCFKDLEKSGVMERDFSVLGRNAWGGADTKENLEFYIRQRLKILDYKYSLE